jgi:hypothetical protein
VFLNYSFARILDFQWVEEKGFYYYFQAKMGVWILFICQAVFGLFLVYGALKIYILFKIKMDVCKLCNCL